MKRILLTLAAMMLVLTACGQNKKEMKTLVAYFSATGTAWTNYLSFPETYRRNRVDFIQEYRNSVREEEAQNVLG